MCNKNCSCEREKVKVYYDKDEDYEEEWYCAWYGCPKCGVRCIKHGFNFCPSCGVEIEAIIAQDNQTALKRQIATAEKKKSLADEELLKLVQKLKPKKEDT